MLDIKPVYRLLAKAGPRDPDTIEGVDQPYNKPDKKAWR